MLKQSRTFWGMFVILLLFWLVVAGVFDVQIAATGFLVTLLTTYFNRDILITGGERPRFSLNTIFWLLVYLKDFLIAVMKANVQVAYMVLSPRMPIEPGLIRFEPGVKTSFNRVVLGNSITLTPGTLTIFCSPDEFMVHALTEENALSLLDWHLVRNLRNMEEESHGSVGVSF